MVKSNTWEFDFDAELTDEQDEKVKGTETTEQVDTTDRPKCLDDPLGF